MNSTTPFMMVLMIIMYVISIPYAANAGLSSERRDSLLAVYHDVHQADTSRMEALYRISQDATLQYLLDEAAYAFARKVWVDSEATGDKKRHAHAIFTIASYHKSHNAAQEAVEHYEKCLELYKELELTGESCRVLTMMGAIYSQYGHQEKAIEYFVEVKEIMEKAGQMDRVVNSLNNIGLMYQQMGDHHKCIQYGMQAEKLSREIGATGHITSLLMMAVSYQWLGDHDKRLGTLEKGLEEATIHEDFTGIATFLGNIGVYHSDRGDHATAISYMDRSLRLNESKGNKPGQLANLRQIASIYQDQSQYSEAIGIYRRAHALAEELRDQATMCKILNEIGLCHKGMDQWDEAIRYYKLSIELNEAIGARETLSAPFMNLAHAYHKLGEMESAFQYYDRSLVLSEEFNILPSMANNHFALAMYHRDMGDLRTALEHGRKAMKIARENGFASIVMKGAQIMWEIHKKNGSHKDALVMHELYMSMRDSINSKLNQREVMRQRFQLEYDKKQALEKAGHESREAIATEALRRKVLERNSLAGGSVLLLLMAGLFFTQKKRIGKEKERSDELLLNILPSEVAEELKRTGSAEARDHDLVSIIFTDFKDFTHASGQMTSQELVKEINECFKAFDHIIGTHRIEKIKTIGDAYMAAGGLPTPSGDAARRTVMAALEMQEFINRRKQERSGMGLPAFSMRLGIHTGPVVAGIVGVKKFQYDIWGDTVNIASRMESNGVEGSVNISQATFEHLGDRTGLVITPRGRVPVKGKGEMEMYFVERVMVEA